MLKIAIISDIHGNLPALNAVLQDIEENFGADQIYCLGDLTDGAPWHNEVIDAIRKLRIPTIMGNHDERIAFDHSVFPLSKQSPEEQEARRITIDFTRDTITKHNKQFLSTLPRSIRLDFSDFKLLLTHASPRSIDEYLYAGHDEDDLKNMLKSESVDVMIVGHTHLSYIRALDEDKKMVINAGSVGRSREADGCAAYLQLTVTDQEGQHRLNTVIQKIPYPVNETINGIRKSKVPDFYADFLLKNIVEAQ